MKILKFKILSRIREAMQGGQTMDEASFNARQWAKRTRARERLKAEKNLTPAPENLAQADKEEPILPTTPGEEHGKMEKRGKVPGARSRAVKGTPA